MAAIVGGLCMEGLWRGWRFAMIGMKKLQDISDVACILSSNGNARVLLTFKKIRLVLLGCRYIPENHLVVAKQRSRDLG